MAILGIDEVGRGPFAGPLVVGAVVLPEWGRAERSGDNLGAGLNRVGVGDDSINAVGVALPEKPKWYEELKDSKKLSAKKREKLAEVIEAEAAVGLGFVMAGEIDYLGMTEALKLGARRAVKEIQRKRVKFSEVIIDGNLNFFKGTSLEKYTTTLIKGDDLIKEISAASIVAKVARDGYMVRAAEEYPEYGFEKHVGYGTALHRAAIAKYGLCPEHRRLVKSLRPIAEAAGEDLSLVFSEEEKKNTTRVGCLAEERVCKYLEEEGHFVVARNFKTRLCEIDIISVFEDKIYFTEVKYRKTDEFGGGLAAVDKKKLERMKFAAEVYMKLYKNGYNPMLAVADVTGEDFRINDWFPVY